MKESHEGGRRLKDELGKVYVIMLALEITEVNVFECKGVASKIVIDRWLVWDMKQKRMEGSSNWIDIFCNVVY